ncbi:ATP synthase F0 subunit B [Atopobacter sp. AH10]|uniref:F0F1 ATP synthase subunit B n=1 Tax=Atopobacter sp. AH10 TaxID=2315861 RepID=UPI000EF213E7|nr:F0F1 ATP synthase subunit B [Atopobacter sp. AH10]RLK64095.1 ATP synthase F0 subunit B [Atopobacter sp. AH10]
MTEGIAAGIAVGDLLVIALSFVLLMVLLGKFVWKPLTKATDERASRIQKDMDEAKQANEEAALLREKAEASIEEARKEAQDIYNRARVASEDMEKQALQQAHEKIAQMKRDAQKEIEYHKEKSMQDLEGKIGDLSVDLAQKILQKGLSAEDHKELIDRFIEGLEKA